MPSPEEDVHDSQIMARLLRGRRTASQSNLSTTIEPEHQKVLDALESARWAPNHHLTQPWTFYVLDEKRIKRLSDLWADIQARKGAETEKVERKHLEWGASKGVMILTCTSALEADEMLQREDYAACCCAAQNFMLHLWSEGLGSKWSTGAVWEHESFWAMTENWNIPRSSASFSTACRSVFLTVGDPKN